MRTNMRSVDDTDLMDWGFVEGELFFQLIVIQRRCTAWNYLPSRRLTEGQSARSSPIERSESELPTFVN